MHQSDFKLLALDDYQESEPAASNAYQPEEEESNLAEKWPDPVNVQDPELEAKLAKEEAFSETSHISDFKTLALEGEVHKKHDVPEITEAIKEE